MNIQAIYRRMTVVLLCGLLLVACAPGGGASLEASPVSATPRVRAWVLMTAAVPSTAAEAIALSFTDGGDEWVIIRADVIDDVTEDMGIQTEETEGAWNLMVVVDAAGEDALKEALGVLTAAVGSEPQHVLRVSVHHPSVPHAAHSFVTSEELEEVPAPEFPEPGRQMPKSPGANPWG